MASITIRNLDDAVMERLRVRAAKHGRSMEEEAWAILGYALAGVTGPNLWKLSQTYFGPEHGIELDLSKRS